MSKTTRLTLSEEVTPPPSPSLYADISFQDGSIHLAFFAMGKHHASYMLKPKHALGLSVQLAQAVQDILKVAP